MRKLVHSTVVFIATLFYTGMSFGQKPPVFQIATFGTLLLTSITY
jgi:hypothetical protein